MIVRGIEIANFRNIAHTELSFSPTFNFFSGRNAQGKTNLLEAIYLFALGRSFRTRSIDEAIRFGEEYLYAKLRGRSDTGVDFTLEAGAERGGRTKVSSNGKRVSGFADIVGIVPGVIFVAEDVMLAGGPPAGRRAYLDYTAAQISPRHLRVLREFRGVLRQRNALLERSAREGSAPAGIEPWDAALAEKGAAIVRMRLETIREIEARARALFDEILGEAADFGMRYVCSFNPSGGDPGEALREALSKAREAERKRGYTMAGPQFDDAQIFLEEAEIRRFGSQGRKRLAALVLKLSQALTILDRRGERPIVLLDDIFSELDRKTAERVKEHLADSYQSFITSPRAEEFGEAGPDAARFSVEAGEIAPAG